MVVNSFTTQLDDIATTTMYKMRSQIADATFDKSPVYQGLKDRGRFEVTKGGRFIDTPIMYDKNKTVQAYSGYDRLPTNPTESLTRAIFNWRQYAGSVVINGYEERINSGSEQIIDLLAHQINLLKMSFADKMAEDLLAQVGTKDTTRQITGIEEIIEPSATQGTLGGIDKNVYTWWQNQYATLDHGVAAATDSRPLYSTWSTFFNDCRQQRVRPGDQMAITTQKVYEQFEKENRDIMRTAPVDQRMFELGWDNFKFRGTPVMWDVRVHQNANGTDDHRFFLIHLPDLKFCVHQGANFAMTPFRTPTDQDAKVAYMLFMGQLITLNNRYHGVLNISNLS